MKYKLIISPKDEHSKKRIKNKPLREIAFIMEILAGFPIKKNIS